MSELFPGHPLGRLITSISDALTLGSSALLTHALNPKLLPLRTRAGLPLVHNISVRPFGQRPYSHCVLQITDVTGAAHREHVLRDRQNARYDAVVESAWESSSPRMRMASSSPSIPRPSAKPDLNGPS